MSEHPIRWRSKAQQGQPFPADLVKRVESLDSYIPERIATIQRKLAADMPHVMRRLENIQRSNRSVRQKLIALREVADDVTRHADGHVACRRGCSHCCHCAVMISEQEAELIGHQIGRKPASPPSTLGHDHVDWGYHNPCPFLRDGECSIYEFRPLECRTMLAVDVDDLLCQLRPELFVDRRPVVDLRYLAHALVRIIARALPNGVNGLHFADIRDWFPRAKPRDVGAP